jgi:hypothetical protein
MDKIILAKALGLECYSHRTDEHLESDIKEDEYYRVIFKFNGKYFEVENTEMEGELSAEAFWEYAANYITRRLLNFMTMEGFRDVAY